MRARRATWSMDAPRSAADRPAIPGQQWCSIRAVLRSARPDLASAAASRLIDGTASRSRGTGSPAYLSPAVVASLAHQQ